MKKEDIIVLDEITEGDDLFKSSGYSYIKVTKNGEVKTIKIPIQSTGITELIDSFSEKAPKPKIKDVKLTPESEQGKEMGITKNTWVRIPDYTDEDYLKEKQKHESDLGIAMLMRGMAMTIKDKAGKIVEERDRKIEILRSMGMSGDQFSQIVQDIQNLTRWTEEERESFLGERLA